MIITTNIPTFSENLKRRLNKALSKENISRYVATNLLPQMRSRIHVQGIDSSGGQIGTYSEGYMAVRTGKFKSNGKVTKGKNKGEVRNGGVFTKGKNKGQPRPNYNRTSDTKVVISLTRQMESDMSVLPVEEVFGIGYTNEDNALKVGYVEDTYKKKIFKLTKDERSEAIRLAYEHINNEIRK